MRNNAIVFDLDGTLIDTLGDIAKAINRALELNGYETWHTEDYRPRIGWGLKHALSHSLPKEERKNSALISRMTNEVVNFYHSAPADHTTIYPGIGDLLKKLFNINIRTAIWTNKNESVAVQVIKAMFPQMWEMFSPIIGDSETRPRKPDPAGSLEILQHWNIKAENILYFGDTDVDMETARSSGFQPYGVSWGYRTEKELIAAGAIRVLQSPEDILNLIKTQ